MGVVVAGVGCSGGGCHCRSRGGDSGGVVVDVVNPRWGGHGGHHCRGWWLTVGAVVVAGGSEGGGVVANVADSGGYCDCGHHCHRCWGIGRSALTGSDINGVVLTCRGQH